MAVSRKADAQRAEAIDAEFRDRMKEAGRQYDRYVTISRLRELPTPQEIEDIPAEPTPTTDRPIGLVIDPQAYPVPPLGLHVRVDG